MITRKSDSVHVLERSGSGRHIFGGPPYHRGITPAGASVPTHRLFEIDLTDPDLPFSSESLRSLPLYYPLKYGYGGPSMQYRILSENRIEIIHISDPQPDPEDEAYVKVDWFPEIRFTVSPPLPSGGEKSLPFDIATVGGTVEYGEDEPCRNPDCPNFESSAQCELLATIPPLPIEGEDDIWWEFEGACMFFFFWQCKGCSTIITANGGT